MSTKNVIKLSKNYLCQARKCMISQNFKKAYSYYTTYLGLQPRQVKLIEEEFISSLLNWVYILEQQNRFEDIVSCYETSTTYYPNNIEILTNFGAFLLRQGCPYQGKVQFEKVLELNSFCIPVSRYLDSAKNALVERWHFRMLNDINRNRCFKDAICRNIKNGYDKVLDIGTGTGILSVFASEAQPKSITACDYSNTMIELANKTLRLNNITDIKLLPMFSNDIRIPQNLPEKVSLLVTETLDACVFGENILQTLIHAWDNLLLPHPYGKVVPHSVSIYVVGIECREISKQHRVFNELLNVFKFNELKIVCHRDEPYDSENLSQMKHYKCLTSEKKCWYVDFNNIDQLKEIVAGKKIPVTLDIKDEGFIDAFVVWFDLHVDNDISINTRNKDNCWDQAVFHLDKPIDMMNKKELDILLSCKDGIFNIDFEKDILPCYKVSLEAVRFLNDYNLMKSIFQHTEYLKTTDKKFISVLDLSPFPIFGLSILKNTKASLTCFSKNDNDKELVKDLCRLNKITSQVNFIDHSYIWSNNEYDIIYDNFLNVEGDLNPSKIMKSTQYKLEVPNCLYFPQKVYIWGQIIESLWLETVSTVKDENTCGCKVADVINEYQTSEHLDICISNLDYKPLSTPQKLVEIFSIMEGRHTKDNILVTENGVVNAILYWFELELVENITSSTNKSSSFINSAVFFVRPNMELEKGQILELNIKQDEGYLNISVTPT